MSKDTYICAEPEQIEAFVDNKGKLHTSRDDAIEQSFRNDTSDAINALVSRSPRLHETPLREIHHLVQCFIQENPDMVRVLIGDRDAT